MLKHICIQDCFPKLLNEYNHNVFKLMSLTSSPSISLPSMVILNDTDINRLFGWAISKSKKRYKKLVTAGSDNIFYDNKFEVLKDMSELIGYIIENIRYVRLYYPLDDAVRNR